MVKVIWTGLALGDLRAITVKLIIEHPNIGKPTDWANVRVKVVKDYMMIYKLTESTIHIHCIWDSRQNPEKVKSILG